MQPKPSEQLPKFKNPPLIEVALGVQFDPIAKFRAAHLGAFWKTLGAEWDTAIDATAISPQFEQFEHPDAIFFNRIQFTLSQIPDIRIQIRNCAQDRMIQVQNGRLHYNWLGHSGGHYPQYSDVKPEFEKIYDLFCSFLATESLDQPRPNQWEITYLNHIPQQSEWQDWLEPRLLSPKIGLGESAESYLCEFRYEIPPKLGRLYVKIQTGIHDKRTDQSIARLELTARGTVDTGNSTNAGLDVGHDAVVRTFFELTTAAGRRQWRWDDGSG